MPFGDAKNLSEVTIKYQIAVRSERFVEPIPFPVNEQLQKRLEFLKAHAPVNVSEEAVCEFLIAPILQEIWIPFSDSLMMWSHVFFGAGPPLQGIPDYFFSPLSPFGRRPGQPYVLFFEAKREKFEPAWGQCVSAMLAAQKMNLIPDQVIYGGVSSGEFWYFACIGSA